MLVFGIFKMVMADGLQGFVTVIIRLHILISVRSMRQIVYLRTTLKIRSVANLRMG